MAAPAYPCIPIPDSVENVGESVLPYCSSLTNATIGNGVTNIGQLGILLVRQSVHNQPGYSLASIGNAAFDFCWRLEQ